SRRCRWTPFGIAVLGVKTMQYLAEVIQSYFEEHFVQAVDRDKDAYIRPVLVGPPHDTLSVLFERLTNSGDVDWDIPYNGTAIPVAVLLVQDTATSPKRAMLSKPCDWDYAVQTRNKWQYALMLAEPTKWDQRPESLANTTETIGLFQPNRKQWWRDP